MKKTIITSALFFGLFPWNLELETCSAQSKDQPVSFTLSDRDRSIRMEEKISSLEKSMNDKFESVNVKFESVNVKFESINVKFESQQQQINDIKTFFYWGFGIMITMMLSLFGYIVWDRRSTLYPLLEKTTLLVEKNKQMEQGR